MGSVVAWGVVALIVVAAIYAWSDDPHWVSRDGQRFTCRVLPLDDVAHGDAAVRAAERELRSIRHNPLASGFGLFGLGGFSRRSGAAIEPGSTRRWLEGKASIDADGRLLLFIRRGFGRHLIGPCRVLAQGEPDRKRAVFVVDGPPRLHVRVPAKSRAVATLEGLVEP